MITFWNGRLNWQFQIVDQIDFWCIRNHLHKLAKWIKIFPSGSIKIHDVILKILQSDAIISLLELQATSVVIKQKKKPSSDSEFQNFKKQSASHIISSLILYYNSNLPSQLNPLWTELISLPTNNALSNGQSTNQNSETVNRLGLLLQTGSSVLRVEPLRTVFKIVGNA